MGIYYVCNDKVNKIIIMKQLPKNVKEKRMKDTFLEIKWRKEDIQKLLKDNGMDSSEQAVNSFLEKFDIQYFEEMCIQTGWEMLQSAI